MMAGESRHTLTHTHTHIHRTISTMVVDFTQLPSDVVCMLIVTNTVGDQPASNASISVNALTSGDLSNSFVCTEPLASYVTVDTGGIRSYIMAKYDDGVSSQVIC